MTSSVPDPRPSPLVVELARGRRIKPVWRNEIGGTTWRLGAGSDETYLKVGPLHPEFGPDADAERYRWLSSWVDVPRPVAVGERDGWGWFETTPVAGHRAVNGVGGVAPEFEGRVESTIRALGAALRHFHDTVPVPDCPFGWSAEGRLALVTPADAERLGVPPSLGADLVVCHGDACNPNFQLHADLSVAGYVDLARCGLGDRWADLAPASMSVGWNFAPGLEPLLLEGYGVGRDLPMDAEKLAWYSDLWNAPFA